MRFLAPVLSLVLLSGCVSGAITRTQATRPERGTNSVIVQGTRDEVWARAIPVLGKTFFIINNIDKQSGLINVSYSGDPERYVDGGMITSYVTGPRGEFRSTFPASRGSWVYNAITKLSNGMDVYSTVYRTLTLDGRANIILEEAPSKQTKITVNIRYIMTKSGVIRTMTEPPSNFTGTASMSTGGELVFPGERDTYYPTGVLEQEILQAFK